MKRIKLFADAVATIKGGNTTPLLFGNVKFYQKKNFVLISVNVDGLPTNQSGFFGFHIHEGNNCSGTDFSNTGSHYNPTGVPHPSHAGDLPPLLSCKGKAYQTVATDRFRVEDIIEKTVVIHSMPDDFTTQPSGNSGAKIGCGVIIRTHH